MSVQRAPMRVGRAEQLVNQGFCYRLRQVRIPVMLMIERSWMRVERAAPRADSLVIWLNTFELLKRIPVYDLCRARNHMTSGRAAW